MKLKIIGWIATVLSLIGVVLNALMIIYCWYFWLASNFLWMYWSHKKNENSQLFLWSIFFFANIYGLYSWLIK